MIVDLLLKHGGQLNEDASPFPFKKDLYSPLLKSLAARGDLISVKGLLARGAACAFDSSENSAMPPVKKDEDQNCQRTRHYLEAVKALQKFDGSIVQLCLGMNPDDKTDFDAYRVQFQKTTKQSTNQEPSTLSTKQVLKSVPSSEVKLESKEISSQLSSDEQKDPLFKAVVELATKSEENLSEQAIYDKLEVAYQAMLVAGCFNLRSVILYAVNEVKTKSVLNFLFCKSLCLYPDSEVSKLMMEVDNNKKHLFHVAISIGAFEFIRQILDGKSGLDRATFNLEVVDINSNSGLTYALQAFKNGFLTIDQTILLLDYFKNWQQKDLQLVVESKSLQLLQCYLNRFSVRQDKLTDMLPIAVRQVTKPEDWDSVDLLLGMCADLTKVSGFSNTWYTPTLNEAAANNKIDIVKGLVKRKVIFGVDGLSVFKHAPQGSRVFFYLRAVDVMRLGNLEKARSAYSQMDPEDRKDFTDLFKLKFADVSVADFFKSALPVSDEKELTKTQVVKSPLKEDEEPGLVLASAPAENLVFHQASNDQKEGQTEPDKTRKLTTAYLTNGSGQGPIFTAVSTNFQVERQTEHKSIPSRSAQQQSAKVEHIQALLQLVRTEEGSENWAEFESIHQALLKHLQSTNSSSISAQELPVNRMQ